MPTWNLFSIILGAALISAAYAPVAQAGKEEKEEKVSLEQLPAAVRATVEAEARGGQLKEVEKETKGATVTYEAEIVKDGKEIDVEIAADGSVLKREVEDDDDKDEDDDE